MKRCLLNMLALVCAMICIATIALWIRGSDWLGRWHDFSRAVGYDGSRPLTDVGQRWIGLYSNAGQIGMARVEVGAAALEPDEIPSIKPTPLLSSWFWNRDGETDSYFGNLAQELTDEGLSWHVPCTISVSPIEDGGMRHFEKIYAIRIDAWFIVALSAIWPLVRFRSAMRHRSLNHDLCLRCGYDLRASPGRCPECGRMPIEANDPQTPPKSSPAL
jgi:hypothetical protein